MNVRRSLALGLAAACFGWAVAVVGLVLGRYTPIPPVTGLEPIVTAGAVVAILVGLALIFRDGYRRIAG